MVILVVGQWVRHEAADVAAHLAARRGFARPQQHRDRARGGGVIHMDRQEAAFAVMGVEQRELLGAVDDIDGVVDVQRHLARRACVAGAIDIDHGVAHRRHLMARRRVLPARDGRLRTQIAAAVRQAPAGQLEGGIGAQIVEVVGVLITAGDGEDAGAQNVGDAVRHQGGIARVGDQGGEPVGDAEAPLGGGQQHHAAIGCEASAIERGGDFLALDGWETERQQGIFEHGGCGSCEGVDCLVSTPKSVNVPSALRDTRQRIPAMTANKMG